MITLLNEIAQAWWSWMGSMLWQASLLILIVTVVDLLIGKWVWPQVRYALWLLILVKLLIPPVWSLPTSIVSRSLPWTQTRIVQLLDGERGSAAGPAAPERAASPAERSGTPAVATAPLPAPAVAGPTWQVWAMGTWLLGMVLFLLLLAARIAKLRRWHREQLTRKTIPPWFHELLVATARRIGLERLPAIVFSDEAVTPAVYGVFRPVLLLPADYTDSLSPEEAEHVLLHELAHLKRGDLWLHGLCLLLQIVYWFNPLLIWVRKQMRHVREICCDLTIASLLKEKTMRYRKTLLDTARAMLSESLEPGMGLLGVFEEPFRLVARLRWLEKDTWSRRGLMRVAALLVVLLAVPLLLPMAAIEAGQTSAGSPAPTSAEATYIREETRWELDRIFPLPDRSEIRGVAELWIGEGRIAQVEDKRRLIIDRDRGTLVVINPAARTYVETTLPLRVWDLLSEELRAFRTEVRYGVQVEKTGKGRTINGRACEEQVVTQWEIRDGVRGGYREGHLWTSTDVEFDLALFDQLIENMRLLQGRDERGMAELGKIRGIQMMWDFKRPGGTLLAEERMVTEIVEIARKAVPDGVFSVPAGFTRKEQLTPDDF